MDSQSLCRPVRKWSFRPIVEFLPPTLPRLMFNESMGHPLSCLRTACSYSPSIRRMLCVFQEPCTCKPDDDLRPGLRATVLCDNTVLSTPMVEADAWVGLGPRTLTGAMPPDITGKRPTDQVELASWFLPAGRHYLMVASPHFRRGGTFRSLQLQVSDQPAKEPLYQFAPVVRYARGQRPFLVDELQNERTGPRGIGRDACRFEGGGHTFRHVCRRHGRSGPGEISSTRLDASAASRAYNLMVAIGNHDAYLASSRPDVLELCPELFPCGTTDYVLEQAPLRFIVLDASYWKDRDGNFMDHYDRKNSSGIGIKPEQVDWLRRQLAADTKTPTLVVWHYPFMIRRGLSTCGYRLPNERENREVLGILETAPNVIGTLAGHTHWNHFNVHDRLHHITNPALAEWPNAYRAFRVYSNRIEWELRQVGNRGFIRESFAPAKALSWQISTVDNDLSGSIVW